MSARCDRRWSGWSRPRLGGGLLFFFLGVVSVRANTFVGTDVLLESYYPNLSSTPVLTVGPETVVDSGVEFPVVFVEATSGVPVWSADVAVATITLNQLVEDNNLGCGNGADAFNGFVFSFFGSTPIASVALNPSSTFTPFAFWATCSQVFIDYQCLGIVSSNLSTILDVTFATGPCVTTTSTTTSSTTTTLPLCGNGLIDAGEQCDPPGSLTSCPANPSGPLVCNAKCMCAKRVGVKGWKFILLDRLSAASKAKVVLVIKDSGIDTGAGTDVSTISGSMRVSYDVSSGEFLMPAGPGWLVNTSAVAKYVNKQAPVGGSVKVSVIKPGTLFKVVAKSLGDTTLDISSAPTGSVFVTADVTNGAESISHCTAFNACVHKVIAGGGNFKLICKGSSDADSACTAYLPPPTVVLTH